MTITRSFMFSLEKRLTTIIEDEYSRLLQKMWWDKVVRAIPAQGSEEIITWLLSTALIEDQGSGGNIGYDELIQQYTTIPIGNSGKALRLRRQLFEDMFNGLAGGKGIQLAQQWASQIGSQMAYWPQKSASKYIKTGETNVAYDSAYFFDTHYNNPYNTGAGTYKNFLTSTASGSYPGTCPIDVSVSLSVAHDNLGKAIGYIESTKMPNGEDPRNLSVKYLLHPPRLGPRARQLCRAEYIPQAVGSVGGSGDVRPVISGEDAWNLTPIQCAELSYDSVYTEGDTTYYLVAEQAASSQLGAIVYANRQNYEMTTYTGTGGSWLDAALARAQEFEWQVHGRNAISGGHPYLIWKCKGS